MFPLSAKLYPSVWKHVHECTWACLRFLRSSPFASLSSASHSFQSPRRPRKSKNKTIVIFFFFINSTSIFLWRSICNPLPSKNRCSGLLWTCKAAEPKPKSGCDVLYVLGLMHIPLAKPVYRHSPPIKLHDWMQPSCKCTVSYQEYGKPTERISDVTANGVCSSNYQKKKKDRQEKSLPKVRHFYSFPKQSTAAARTR